MANDGVSFADFLSFRRMVTPIIIQVVFWVLTVLIIIGVIAFAVSGFIGIVHGIDNDSCGTAFVGFLTILIAIIVGVLYFIYVRIACEMTILFFRMNETLTDIKNNTSK